ncbi:hypothetical protein [Pseudochryseolinea flava]|uniref:Uncharacterized protein n=1 Tax=Pseudochryseolinea flava TaxID=2059302 RepID=A0A364Y8H5_9BACT|nr:hypothetical protein [Pseudochryseolinea flava]RAW03287.1 hypothetical protein DQQ10_04175 [Pseudochryseolinea flava]
MKAVVFIFLLAAQQLHAQQLIASLPVKKSALSSNAGMISGDSLFLAYRATISSPTETVWISPSGRVTRHRLAGLEGKSLLAAVPYEDSTFYYYVESSRKSFVVKALTEHRVNFESKVYANETDIPGTLVGSFIDSKQQLNLLCVDRESFYLRLIVIARLDVKGTKSFALTSKALNTRIMKSFIPQQSVTTTYQALAPIKIMQYDHGVYLMIDNENDKNTGNTKTTVTKIDFTSGETETKALFDLPYRNNHTAILDEQIYRLNADGMLRVQSFNSGDVVFEKSLRDIFKTDSLFVRRDKVYTRKEVADRWRGCNFLIVDKNEMGTVNVTLGMHTESSFIVAPAGVPLAAMLSAFAASLVIDQLAEKPGKVFYKTISISTDGIFAVDRAKHSIRQRIDEFESATRTNYQYRGYCMKSNLAYCIYQEKGSDQLKVHKFDTKNSIQ